MNSQAAAMWNSHVDIFFAKTGGIIAKIVAAIAQWLVNDVACYYSSSCTCFCTSSSSSSSDPCLPLITSGQNCKHAEQQQAMRIPGSADQVGVSGRRVSYYRLSTDDTPYKILRNIFEHDTLNRILEKIRTTP